VRGRGGVDELMHIRSHSGRVSGSRPRTHRHELAKTTRPIPQRADASSTFHVARMLSRKTASHGACGLALAAKWSSTSAPARARSHAGARGCSHRSGRRVPDCPRLKSAAMLDRPRTRTRSISRSSCESDNSAVTKRPIRPAAPVTTTRTADYRRSSHRRNPGRPERADRPDSSLGIRGAPVPADRNVVREVNSISVRGHDAPPEAGRPRPSSAIAR
jgi:hypothetical protein